MYAVSPWRRLRLSRRRCSWRVARWLQTEKDPALVAIRARGAHWVSSSSESAASVVCNHSATAMHHYRGEQRGLSGRCDWPGKAGVAPSARGSLLVTSRLTPTTIASTKVKQTGVELIPGGLRVLWIRNMPRCQGLGISRWRF